MSCMFEFEFWLDVFVDVSDVELEWCIIEVEVFYLSGGFLFEC